MKLKIANFISMLVLIGTTAMGQKIDTTKIANKDQNLLNKAHKDRDVEIFFFETEHNNQELYSYFVTIYKIEDGNLKEYTMATALKKNKKNVFDKAVYKWENDSAIVFKLINSSGKCSGNYRMIGSPTTTSMGVYSKEFGTPEAYFTAEDNGKSRKLLFLRTGGLKVGKEGYCEECSLLRVEIVEE